MSFCVNLIVGFVGGGELLLGAGWKGYTWPHH